MLQTVNQYFIEVVDSLKKQGIIKKDTDFAKNLSISPQLLSEILKDRTNIRHELLQKFCIMYGVNLSYIYYGKEPKFITDENYYPNYYPHYYLSDTNALLKDKKSVPVIPGNKNVMESPGGIPFYETLPASAGDIKSFLDTQQPTSFINMPQISDCSAVLPVYGSSMRGIIEPGDLIAVKELTARSQFDPCLPYLIITTDHRMIKYLRSDAEDATIIWAESTNHKPIKLNADTILYIYIIKCVIRFF